MSYNRQQSSSQTIRSRFHQRDIAVLLSVPVPLILLFLLPTPVRESLAFNYTDPSLLTAFTSAFIHLNVTHLSVNLAGYLLVVPLTYAMSVICGHRQRFYVSFATYVLVFPPLLTMFQLLFVRPGMGLGFSGVLMAFYGYLPLVMSDFVAEQFDIDAETNIAPLLFFIGLGLITILGVFPSLDSVTVLLGSAGLVLAILVIVLWYGLSIRSYDVEWRKGLAQAWAVTGHFEVFLTGLIVFLAFPFAMFPLDIGPTAVVVDTYTHLLGFSLGFIAIYTSSYLSRLLSDESDRTWL